MLGYLDCSRAHVVVFPNLGSFLWGVVVILTVVIESYQGLVVQRVFLGLLEVGVQSSPIVRTESDSACALGSRPSRRVSS
jgi:hypothetical protein